MNYSAIDLSSLPPPDVIRALDYEQILAALREDAIARDPGLAGVLTLESEPINILLEVAAYRELNLRAYINDAARAMMLAFAAGADLEHLAALFNVARQVIVPADPAANPPLAAVLETDARLRQRVQMALEGYTSAGSVGAYDFHARSASPRVLDVDVFAPGVPGGYKGEVVVTILSDEAADGTPSAGTIATVNAALSADHVRPISDLVTVQPPADVLEFTVEAELAIGTGPSSAVVEAAADAALTAYLAERFRLGATVARSGILAALHVAGVDRVELTEPPADLEPAHDEVAWCAGVTLTTVEPDG